MLAGVDRAGLAMLHPQIEAVLAAMVELPRLIDPVRPLDAPRSLSLELVPPRLTPAPDVAVLPEMVESRRLNAL